MQPLLKPPRIKRLKLHYDRLLSSYAFKLNLRRYTEAVTDGEDSVDAGLRTKGTEVGTDGWFSPRHETRLEPSFLELSDIL